MLSAPPGKMAPWSSSLTGGFKGIASAKPPLVMEITVRIPKSKSLIQGASVKTEDLIDPVQKTPTNRNERAQTRQETPKVCMIEVPDIEDDTSFQMSMKTKLIPPVAPEVTQSMVVESPDSNAKTEKVPHQWLKPFGAEVDITWIVEARTESEAKVILKNWIHKTHTEEVVDEMIKGMWKAMWVNALWWLEEL